MTTITNDDRTGAAALGRQLAVGALGAAAFGVAAATGHGALAMTRAVWMGPALFVGGAALATPPLYLFGALAGSRLPAVGAADRCGRALAAVGTALLGLAPAAAFVSTTMRTFTAPLLLVVTCAVAGGAGVAAVTTETMRSDRRPGVHLAALLWTGFALALGVRLIVALSHRLDGVMS